jgi:transposase
MPAPLRIVLDDATRQTVAARFEQTHDAETRLRYQMVLLAADGRTAPQIAPLVRRSRATVERVLGRYLREGLDGVPHRRRPGRRSPAPPQWAAELARVIELDPHAVGVPSAVWTLRRLRDYLAQVSGHHTSLETVRQALRRLDYRCKRPVHSVKRKAQEQPDWPKKVSGWRRSERWHHPRLHPSSRRS